MKCSVSKNQHMTKSSIVFPLVILLLLSSCHGTVQAQLHEMRKLDCAAASKEKHEMKFFPAAVSPRGIFVVAHGLNNKPSSMDPLIKELNAAGFHALRLLMLRRGLRRLCSGADV